MKSSHIHNQYASKPLSEILGKIKDLSKELFSLRMKNSLRSLQQTHLISIARKDIARLKTLARTISLSLKQTS